MDTSAKPARQPGLFWPFVSLGVGVFLILSGTEYLLLGVIGKPDTAIVTYAAEVSHYRGGKSYTAYYEFTTEDGAQYSGSESGFPRKPGSVRVRYMPGYPAINRGEATTAATVLMVSFYLLPGLLGLAFGLWGLFRRALAPPPPETLTSQTPPQRGSVGAWASIGIAFFLGFAAYGVDRRELFLGTPADEGAPQGPAGAPGNSAGNLSQDGQFAFDGAHVYFSEFGYKPIHRAAPDGTQFAVVHDGAAHFLNLAGDFVYFLQFDSGEGVRAYRVPKAGGKAKRLMSDSLSGLWVVGEWLYFTPEHNNKLHRARLDGSRAQKLHDDIARWVAFTPEWVYYCNEAHNNRIFRMRHNGAERQQLGEARAAELLPEGDGLFYRNEGDGNRIWRMNADGSGDARFLDADARCLNSDGTWLYFCDFADDAHLYRVSLKGGEPERLTEVSALNPHIAGDWIYVGVGDLITELIPHRLRRDDGTGRAGKLERWPPAEAPGPAGE